MNKKLFSALAVASFAVSAFAEDAASEIRDSARPSISQNENQNTMSNATSKLDFIEQNGQKFIHVSTIGTVDANRQFMQNVNLVNQQRQQIALLDEARKIVAEQATRDALTKEIETAAKKLDENNAAMLKAYGYSLAGKYIHAIVKTRIFIKLTEEEYKKVKEDPETKSEDLLVKGDDKFRLIAVIPGVEENNNFRRNVQLVQAQRNQLIQMKKADETATGEQKAKLEEEIKKAEETLIKNNEEMTKRYGFSLARDYLMEVEESKLYTLVNEEQFLKAEKLAEEAALSADAKKVIEDAKN